jgi:uncharacterized protein
MMIGTLVNAAAILAGGTAGLLIHSRLPARFTKIVFQGIGLFTIFLGFSMALKTGNYLVMIFSIVLGSISGELIDIDKRINQFSDWMKKLTVHPMQNSVKDWLLHFFCSAWAQ